MTNPHEAAAQGGEQALLLQRLIALFWPNATDVQIKAVNQSGSEIQITDYQATLPDGSTVYAPHITIRRG